MARGAIVKHEDAESGPAGEPKASKRRCVQSACVPCRKRKSKCDGGLPVCATCTAVYKTPCSYDSDSRTKAAGTRRDGSVVSTTPASHGHDRDDAESLLAALRSLPDADVHELVQHIRKNARLDTASLATSWRKATAFAATTPIEPQSLDRDLSMLLGKPAMTPAGDGSYFDHTSAMSLIPDDEHYPHARMAPIAADERTSGTWTAVTNDVAFVERLLDLYFRWSHTFYVIFSRECFYKDFRSGRDKYCSPLLVNAILAYACHFTDEPAARIDPDNSRSAGDHFFDEARRLLYQDETPSLTTTQALCVMAMREPSAGRDSSGFMYMGRCMRMSIELGLHLNSSAAPTMQLTPSEVEVRKVTFWGCFTVDMVWSICVGRISQLPRAAITLDKPILDESSTDPQPDAFASPRQPVHSPVTSRMFLQEFSTLSELINDNNYMFFAPKERFTSRRLLECYDRYQQWYRNLPQQLKLEGVREPQPHIIVLHMLYYTTVVHLFRPMLKVDLIHSNVRPRDSCVDAANQVAKLLRLYRQHFKMRACQLVLTHVLLSVCVVHLLYSTESPVSYRNLVEGLQALEDLSTCHYFGRRSFKIIHALSQVWQLPFPDELKGSKLLSSSDVASPIGDNILLQQPTTSIASRLGGGVGYNPIPTPAPPSRRESLSMFARPGRKSVPLPSHTAPSQIGGATSAQLQHRQSQPNIIAPYLPSTTTTPSLTTSVPSPSPAGSAETLFWTPVPGMGVPILPRNYHLSPMDLDSMLGNVNEWDRFSRDGFKMSETWQQDAVPSYNGGHPEDFNHGDGGTNNNYNNTSDITQYDHGNGMHQEAVQHGGGQTFDADWWAGEGQAGTLS